MNNFESKRKLKSAPSTPGTGRRRPPTSLSLHPLQSDCDPGTPTSLASGSTGGLNHYPHSRLESPQLPNSASLHSLGFSIPEAGTEAAKRREVLPGKITIDFHFQNSGNLFF